MCTNTLRLLGQELFNPPNVKGWDGGKAWISTSTLLARYNLAGLLDAAALDAVKQWVYTPTTLNGVPVPVIMTVTVNFTLQ